MAHLEPHPGDLSQCQGWYWGHRWAPGCSLPFLSFLNLPSTSQFQSSRGYIISFLQPCRDIFAPLHRWRSWGGGYRDSVDIRPPHGKSLKPLSMWLWAHQHIGPHDSLAVGTVGGRRHKKRSFWGHTTRRSWWCLSLHGLTICQTVCITQKSLLGSVSEERDGPHKYHSMGSFLKSLALDSPRRRFKSWLLYDFGWITKPLSLSTLSSVKWQSR